MAASTTPLYLGLPTLPPELQRILDNVDAQVEQLRACPDTPMMLLALAKLQMNVTAKCLDPMIQSGIGLLRLENRLDPDRPAAAGGEV